MFDGMMLPAFPRMKVGMLSYLQEIDIEASPSWIHFELHLCLILTLQLL